MSTCVLTSAFMYSPPLPPLGMFRSGQSHSFQRPDQKGRVAQLRLYLVCLKGCRSLATIPAKESMDSYFDLPGLSQSGMKDLEISPLRYWHLHINPNRPEPKVSLDMTFGSALHCLILEPEKFPMRYAKGFDAAMYPDALDTISDIRSWISSKGGTPRGSTKLGLIEQAHGIDPDVQLVVELEASHAAETEGMELLKPVDWERIHGCAGALQSHPSFMALMAEGEAEVAMSAVEPENGVLLKAKMDWVNPYCIMDIKTFGLMRDQPIDEAVADAIYYRRYYRQAYLYSLIRSLQPGSRPLSSSRFVFAFVESSEPYEVRLREVRPGGLLWARAAAECNALIWQYKKYSDRFGIVQWRDDQQVVQLDDEDIRQLAFS